MTIQASGSQGTTTGSLRYAKQEAGRAEAARIAELRAALEPLYKRLSDHPVYGRLRSLDDVAVFMSHHVFAVWDFMTLLKSLQTRLTGTSLPWRPTGDATTRRLVNEIVLAEESDEIAPGRYASHYELYLEAMAQAGVSDATVRSLVDRWQSGSRASDVVENAELPEAVEAFVAHTWRVAITLDDHSVAAAFAFGRETVLPTLFSRLLASLPADSASRLTCLQSYLNRHIELDGEIHHDLSIRMLASLCGDDDRKWQDARVVAQTSLEARLALWDGVVNELDRKLN